MHHAGSTLLSSSPSDVRYHWFLSGCVLGACICDFEKVEQEVTAMTKTNQRRIICELLGSVKKTMLTNVDRMPVEWDGVELRQYAADKFDEQASIAMPRERYKDYRNAVLTWNL